MELSDDIINSFTIFLVLVTEQKPLSVRLSRLIGKDARKIDEKALPKRLRNVEQA